VNCGLHVGHLSQKGGVGGGGAPKEKGRGHHEYHSWVEKGMGGRWGLKLVRGTSIHVELGQTLHGKALKREEGGEGRAKKITIPNKKTMYRIKANVGGRWGGGGGGGGGGYAVGGWGGGGGGGFFGGGAWGGGGGGGVRGGGVGGGGGVVGGGVGWGVGRVLVGGWGIWGGGVGVGSFYCAGVGGGFVGAVGGGVWCGGLGGFWGVFGLCLGGVWGGGAWCVCWGVFRVG